MMTTRQISPDARAAIRDIERGIEALRAATADSEEHRWAAYSSALHALVGGVSGIPDDRTWIGRMKAERYTACKALATGGATHRHLAEAVGISRSRVSQILGSDRLAQAANRVTLASGADQLPLPAAS